MSKFIKQLQLQALSDRFAGVRDMIVLSIEKLSAINDNELRNRLAKKKVKLFMVKNSFTRKVFRDLGMNIDDDSALWKGPTVMAWGCDSVGELSRVVDEELKDKKKASAYRAAVKIKGAIVDGRELDFETAKKMPTREEAIANVIMLALSPAAKVAGQLIGSASTIAGQIKSLAEEEKSDGEPPSE